MITDKNQELDKVQGVTSVLRYSKTKYLSNQIFLIQVSESSRRAVCAEWMHTLVKALVGFKAWKIKAQNRPQCKIPHSPFSSL